MIITTRKYICHYCYETGHNKRTCPKFATEASENPESFTANKYKAMKEKNSKRHCHYCNEIGHNIVTCEKLKGDKIEQICKNRDFRKVVWDLFLDKGIGIGAMVEIQKTSCKIICFIKEIIWDSVGYRKYYNFGHKSIIMKDFGQNNCSSDLNITISDKFIQIMKDDTNYNYNESFVYFNILVPAPKEILGAGMPPKWIDGISGLKNFFKY